MTGKFSWAWRKFWKNRRFVLRDIIDNRFYEKLTCADIMKELAEALCTGKEEHLEYAEPLFLVLKQLCDHRDDFLNLRLCRINTQVKVQLISPGMSGIKFIVFRALFVNPGNLLS